MRSSRGSTAPGSSRATPSSPRRPAGSSISTPAGGKASCLHPGDYVVCCDEKPSIQARRRKHTTLPTKPGVKRGQRVEHEYEQARRTVLLRGLGRTPREAVRPLRREGRDRPVRQARRTVHERRALQQSPTRVRDRRQRLRAPRQEIDQTTARPLQEPDPRPHPGPRQLAQPGRDLLLDRPAQGPHPQRLPRPRTRSNSNSSRSVAATSRSPNRSSGSSPAPTSTVSPTSSTAPPPKPPDPNTSANFRARADQQAEPSHDVGLKRRSPRGHPTGCTRQDRSRAHVAS